MTTPTTALLVQIRRELREALAAGPSTLPTYPAAAIASALDDDVIEVIDRSEPSGRPVYALTLRPELGRRPSSHPSFTKSYAIDQIGDIDYLRRVTHATWEAFSAAHWQVSHVLAALRGGPGGCVPCAQAADAADSLYACAEWRAKEAAVAAGFGSV